MKGYKQPCPLCKKSNTFYARNLETRECKDREGCQRRRTEQAIKTVEKNIKDRQTDEAFPDEDMGNMQCVVRNVRPIKRRGAVAVEMAICAPFVCFALVAMMDLVLASLTASNVQTATAAASTLVSQNKKNAHRHVIRQVCGIPKSWHIEVTTAPTTATDAYGQTIYTATITISAPYEWMTIGVSSLVGGDGTGPANKIVRTATTPIINSPP